MALRLLLIISVLLTHLLKDLFRRFPFLLRFPSTALISSNSPFFPTIYFSVMNTLAPKFSESDPSMSDDSERSVQVRPMNLDHYLHDEIHARRDQVADPKNLLHGIDYAHCHALAETLRDYNFGHACGMMTVYFRLPSTQNVLYTLLL